MRERLPSFPSVPRAAVRYLQGLMLLSLGADGVSCGAGQVVSTPTQQDGTLDALSPSGQ